MYKYCLHPFLAQYFVHVAYVLRCPIGKLFQWDLCSSSFATVNATVYQVHSNIEICMYLILQGYSFTAAWGLYWAHAVADRTYWVFLYLKLSSSGLDTQYTSQ